MIEYKYYIGCQDYFGENCEPDKIFNNKIVPYLRSCGLNDEQIKEVWKMTSKLAEEAWQNGSNDAECSINEY